LPAIEKAAARHPVQLKSANLSDASEVERTIDQFAREPNVGLILVADPIATLQLELFIALAARYRLPAIFERRKDRLEIGLVREFCHGEVPSSFSLFRAADEQWEYRLTIR
jgi:hypothetical protein